MVADLIGGQRTAEIPSRLTVKETGASQVAQGLSLLTSTRQAGARTKPVLVHTEFSDSPSGTCPQHGLNELLTL